MEGGLGGGMGVHWGRRRDREAGCKLREKGGGQGRLREGGTPLYTYGYVPPSRVGFLRCSVLKSGILFGIFWLFFGIF